MTWKVLVTKNDPETKKWKETQKYESGKKKKINTNIIFILNQKKSEIKRPEKDKWVVPERLLMQVKMTKGKILHLIKLNKVIKWTQ